MFSCKRSTSTKFVRSELTVETLASPKHGKIIFTKVLIKLLHVPNKTDKRDSLVLRGSDLRMA